MKKSELDASNLKVEEFTTVDPITVSPDCSLSEAKSIMTKNNIRHIPVTVEGVAKGLISEREFIALDDDKLSQMKVHEVMIDDPFTVLNTDLLKDVVFQMSSRKIGSSLVNDSDNKLFGIFTSIDALNTIIELL